MTDPDVKAAIENMPFFMEMLALRFDEEECRNLPELCRAVATEIDRLQEQDEIHWKTRRSLLKENERLKVIISDEAETPGKPEPQIDDSRTGLLAQREVLLKRQEFLEEALLDNHRILEIFFHWDAIDVKIKVELVKRMSDNRKALGIK